MQILSRKFYIKDNVLYYTWDDLEDDLPVLELKLRGILAGKKFNGVLGIPRGGVVLETKLSHIFDLRVLSSGVDDGSLVVDDISDGMKGGVTLLPYKVRGATLATLFYHPNSKVEPHIWLHKKEVNYVYFPWQNTPYPTRSSLPSP
jgi:hypothetical protein